MRDMPTVGARVPAIILGRGTSIPGVAATIRRSDLGKVAVRGHIEGHVQGMTPQRETPMQTRNKILDDLSQLMTNAVGVAHGAKAEAETAMKNMLDRWLADRNFVTREEFDAVRAMAQKAREENETLRARLDALGAAGKGGA